MPSAVSQSSGLCARSSGQGAAEFAGRWRWSSCSMMLMSNTTFVNSLVKDCSKNPNNVDASKRGQKSKASESILKQLTKGAF